MCEIELKSQIPYSPYGKDDLAIWNIRLKSQMALFSVWVGGRESGVFNQKWGFYEGVVK